MRGFAADSAQSGRKAELSASFGGRIAKARARGELVVQPRMGFGNPALMRSGLAAVKRARAATVGTITVDSYTRVGDMQSAACALAAGRPLNGYPIASHGADVTDVMLAGIADERFPVQVRHGSAAPEGIIRALVKAGMHATEGGPVSYCFPYGRTPLEHSVENWARGCELLVQTRPHGRVAHMETFGGCLIGQLCPPSLLLAISVLEGIFFVQHGLLSISLSYAQQANREQDVEALRALRRMTRHYFPTTDTHIVLYAYMGLYPETAAGSRRLLAEAARLAVEGGADRLIVKTVAEAHHIPSVRENVEALEFAYASAATASALAPRHRPQPSWPDESVGRYQESGLYDEAQALVSGVLQLDADLGRALLKAFKQGLLDIPFCVHPDNPGRAQSYLSRDGRTLWSTVGSLPIKGIADVDSRRTLTSTELIDTLSYVRRKFDGPVDR
ncbi:methylaspartate mutase [Streptomyces sp. NPDC098077]|uniref:methylaspartate mutase n=1 Tax=Streptomyces sp. NPDC098077 TaxID=3366093 RepID=UPI00381A9D7D